MHISDASVFNSSTTTLKKRKRDVVGGGDTWNQENALQGNIPAYQIDIQDINMLSSPPRFNLEPASSPPITTLASTSSQRQWLYLQPPANTMSEMQKKRRILQPHPYHQQQHFNQQQQLRPHSGNSAVQTSTQSCPADYQPHSPRKTPPPTLMIPLFDNQRDPEFSSTPSLDEYDAVSPRTTTIPPQEASALPPPVLRPCHVCHRKPSTKVMLDAYADCELCGQRACYICLRECNSSSCDSGWAAAATTTTAFSEPDEFNDDVMHCTDIRREDGYLHTRPHSRMRRDGGNMSILSRIRQRKICSCCAVEGLTDTGEEIVWCLSCVRREETTHQR